jgi:hypothetical protein
MKFNQDHKRKKVNPLRIEIMKSMLASFKIEGISISNESATAALKKIEVSLEK